MKYLFYGFCFCCVGFLTFAYANNKIPEDDAELSRVIKELAVYAEKEYNLTLAGTGICCPGNVFLSQGLSFTLKHQLTKNECRVICSI